MKARERLGIVLLASALTFFLALTNSNAQSFKLYQEGRIDEAIQAYKKALKLNPEDGYIYLMLGVLYEDKKTVEKAAYYFKASESLYPKKIDFYNSRGMVYFQGGKLDKAATDVKEALKIDPKNPLSHFLLGNIYEAEDRFAEAITQYEIVSNTKNAPAQLVVMARFKMGMMKQQETKLIKLYFSDSQGKYLVPEERKILALSRIDEEAEEILKELIKGPFDSSLKSTIPPQIEVRNVYVKDDCFYVDFSSSLREKHPGGTVAELLTIYSIVNTLLINFPSQSRVRILIQGEPAETLTGNLIIRGRLSKKLDIVKVPYKLPEAICLFEMPVNPDEAYLIQKYDVPNPRAEGYYHTGIDLYTKGGKPTIHPTAPGTVVLIQPNGPCLDYHGKGGGCEDHGLGNAVIIEHVLENGQRIYSLYAHLDSIDPSLSNGMSVDHSHPIGTMGASGYGLSDYWKNSDGTPAIHLHFEIKDEVVLSNPKGEGTYFGYTPASPDNYGYHNPYTLLGKAKVLSPAQPQKKETAKNYYPLNEGKRWEYEFLLKKKTGGPFGKWLGGESQVSAKIVITNLPQRELKGKKVTPQHWQVKRGESDYTSVQFTFLAEDETGLYQVASQEPEQVEPEIKTPPPCLIKYPIKVGTVSRYTVASSLEPKVSVPVKDTIESIDEIVTVPAGTFKECLKIKSIGSTEKRLDDGSKVRIDTEGYLYFAPGVGLIKMIAKEKKTASDGTPGITIPPPESRETIIQLETFK